MGNVNKRDFHLALDALELLLHILAQAHIKGAERLVKKQDLRVINKSPRYGDALLLSARKARYASVLEALEVDYLEHFVHAGPDLVLRHLFDIQSEGDIVVNVEMGEQGIFLEHRVHLAFMRRDVVNPHTVKKNVAGSRYEKAAHYSQSGGLSAA